MRKFALTINAAAVLALAGLGYFWAVPKGAAQCNGIFPANTLCGNLGASPAPPAAFSANMSVFGPGSTTTSGDVVLWGNATGTQLADAVNLHYTSTTSIKLLTVTSSLAIAPTLTSSNTNAVVIGSSTGIQGSLLNFAPVAISGILQNAGQDEFMMEIDAVTAAEGGAAATFKGPLFLKVLNLDNNILHSSNALTIFANQTSNATNAQVEGIVTYTNSTSPNSDGNLMGIEVGVGPSQNTNNSHCDQVGGCHTALWVGNDGTVAGSWMLDSGSTGPGYNNGLSLRLLQTTSGSCGQNTGLAGNGGCAWQASDQNAVVRSYISNIGVGWFGQQLITSGSVLAGGNIITSAAVVVGQSITATTSITATGAMSSASVATGPVSASSYAVGTVAGVSCSAGTVSIATFVVTNGIVTHC